MIGEIKEREEPAEVKPMVIGSLASAGATRRLGSSSSLKSGFPTPKKLTSEENRGVLASEKSLKRLERVREATKAGIVRSMGEVRSQIPFGSPPRPPLKQSDATQSGTISDASHNCELPRSVLQGEEDNGYKARNRELVASMSEEERAQAMQELSQLLSPDTLMRFEERIKKKSAQEEQQARPSGQDKAPHPSSVHTPTPVESSLYPAGKIAVTLEELQQKQRTTLSAREQSKLEWIGLDSMEPRSNKRVGGDLNERTETDKVDAQMQQMIARTMHNERFDLTGRKVVQDRQQLSERLTSALAELQLPPEGLSAVVAVIVKELSGGLMIFADDIMREVDASSEPQHYLFQHEQEGTLPGYNFTEISELFRSGHVQQRQVAVQILAGILRHRDIVTSLEAHHFSVQATTSLDVELKKPTEATLVASFETIVREVYATMACNANIGSSDTLLRLLASSSSSSHTEEHGALTQESNSRSSSSPSAAALRQCLDFADIKRVVVYAILLCVSSDFPVDLPLLLLYGVKQGSSRPQWYNKTEELRLLQRYLSSGEDCPYTPVSVTCEREYSLLEQHPPGAGLVLPHTRRLECPYEQLLSECSQERDRVLTLAGEALSEEGTARPDFVANDVKTLLALAKHSANADAEPASMLLSLPYQSFVMSCRWHRVDSLFLHSKLSLLLYSYLKTAIVQLATDTATSSSMPGSHTNQGQEMGEVMLSMLSTVCDILSVGLRGGSRDTVAVIERCVLIKLFSDSQCKRSIWQLLRKDVTVTTTDTPSDGQEEPGHRALVKARAATCLLHLLSHASRTSTGFSVFLLSPLAATVAAADEKEAERGYADLLSELLGKVCDPLVCRVSSEELASSPLKRQQQEEAAAALLLWRHLMRTLTAATDVPWDGELVVCAYENLSKVGELLLLLQLPSPEPTAETPGFRLGSGGYKISQDVLAAQVVLLVEQAVLLLLSCTQRDVALLTPRWAYCGNEEKEWRHYSGQKSDKTEVANQPLVLQPREEKEHKQTPTLQQGEIQVVGRLCLYLQLASQCLVLTTNLLQRAHSAADSDFPLAHIACQHLAATVIGVQRMPSSASQARIAQACLLRALGVPHVLTQVNQLSLARVVGDKVDSRGAEVVVEMETQARLLLKYFQTLCSSPFPEAAVVGPTDVVSMTAVRRALEERLAHVRLQTSLASICPGAQLSPVAFESDLATDDLAALLQHCELVSSGAHMWAIAHTLRLLAQASFAAAYLRGRAAGEGEVVEVAAVRGQLQLCGQAQMQPADTLLSFLLDHFLRLGLGRSVAGDTTMTEAVSRMHHQVKRAILPGSGNSSSVDSESSEERVYRSLLQRSRLYLTGCPSPSPITRQKDTHDIVYTPLLPLIDEWPVLVLYELSITDYFHLWLAILNSHGPLHATEEGEEGLHLLFLLLRLGTPELQLKWYDLGKSIGRSKLANPLYDSFLGREVVRGDMDTIPEDSMGEEEEEASLAAACVSYVNLLLGLVANVAINNYKVAVSEKFTAVCQMEADFSAAAEVQRRKGEQATEDPLSTGGKNANREVLVRGSRNRRPGGSKRLQCNVSSQMNRSESAQQTPQSVLGGSEQGLRELTHKLLQSGSEQWLLQRLEADWSYNDHFTQFHSVPLLLLMNPFVSAVSAQVKVWSEVGKLKFLHLVSCGANAEPEQQQAREKEKKEKGPTALAEIWLGERGLLHTFLLQPTSLHVCTIILCTVAQMRGSRSDLTRIQDHRKLWLYQVGVLLIALALGTGVESNDKVYTWLGLECPSGSGSSSAGRDSLPPWVLGDLAFLLHALPAFLTRMRGGGDDGGDVSAANAAVQRLLLEMHARVPTAALNDEAPTTSLMWEAVLRLRSDAI